MKPARTLEEIQEEIEARKHELGITDEMIAAARNSGVGRTRLKREQLARIQERARAAGLEPYPAKF